MKRELPVRFCEGGGVQFPSATRLVILTRNKAREALAAARGILERMGLTLNDAKTRLSQVPENSFNFVGFTFGLQHGPGGTRYLGLSIATKSLTALRGTIRDQTGAHLTWRTSVELKRRLLPILRGFWNYFSLGTRAQAVSRTDRFWVMASWE